MAPSTWWDPSHIRETVDQSGPRKAGGPKMIDLREDSPVGSSINHATDISCDDGVKSEETDSPTRMPSSVQSTAEVHVGSDGNVDSKPTDSNKSTTTVCYSTGSHLNGDDNVDSKSTSGDKRTSTKRKVDAVVSARSEACKKKSLYADASFTIDISSKGGLDAALIKEAEEFVQLLFPEARIRCSRHSSELLQKERSSKH